MSIEEVYEYWSQITIADDFKKSAYLGKSVLCKLRGAQLNLHSNRTFHTLPHLI